LSSFKEFVDHPIITKEGASWRPLWLFRAGVWFPARRYKNVD